MPRSLAYRLGWLPIPLLAAAIVGFWLADIPGSYESPGLVLALNLLFAVLVSVLVACLVGQGFRVHGSPGLLMLGCGLVVWGSAGFLGTIAGLATQDSEDLVNVMVTVHNCCAWLSGFCHLAGVMLSLRPGSARRGNRASLVAAYSLSLVAVGAIALAAGQGWTPPFIVLGEGGTLARKLVLSSAVAMFLIAAVLLRSGFRRPLPPFLHWYSLALALIAIGLFGVMLQSSLGSLLNWTGRAAQVLGGVYLLVAAMASMRESRAWELPLEIELQRERSLASAVL
ncbi:MAG: MASE3 domain-containing protein, partial [Thermoguttaceae bacterium]